MLANAVLVIEAHSIRCKSLAGAWNVLNGVAAHGKRCSSSSASDKLAFEWPQERQICGAVGEVHPCMGQSTSASAGLLPILLRGSVMPWRGTRSLSSDLRTE